MTKIDIFSGFLGSGKTTLIKKLVKEAYVGQKVVLVENEFGEIGIDGGFLADAGINITEINSGCICCSLTGDFRVALKKIYDEYSPDRIIIEPSGVGKLSEVASAVMSTEGVEFELNGLVAVVDAGKCKIYMKNFGEFFDDQVSFAHTIILSRTQNFPESKVVQAAEMLREKNHDAVIMTADWNDLCGKEMLKIIDGHDALSEELENIIKEHSEECGDPDCECHHHHEHHHDDECHHEHEHHHEGECHHEHEHHHDEECCHEHEHEHHHDHDHCGCGHDHHHHDADEVFTSWGVETAKRYSIEEIKAILEDFEDAEKFGFILRAKGIVQSSESGWIHFDYTPGEADVRTGNAAPTGLLCVIGSKINEDAIKESFKL